MTLIKSLIYFSIKLICFRKINSIFKKIYLWYNHFKVLINHFSTYLRIRIYCFWGRLHHESGLLFWKLETFQYSGTFLFLKSYIALWCQSLSGWLLSEQFILVCNSLNYSKELSCSFPKVGCSLPLFIQSECW